MAEAQNPFRERLGLLVPINNLQPRQQEQLLAAAEILTLRRKEYLFRQGDHDHYSFYLLAGELEMVAGDQLIKKVIGGEATSFHPLAQLQPRQMSAVAVTNVQILRIDRRVLDTLLSVGTDTRALTAEPAIEVEEYETVGSNDWLATLLQSELFARIPPSNIQRLIDTLETTEVKAGDVIIQQGAAGDYYYVIQAGTCEVCRATRVGKDIRLAELGPGDTFGEEALVSNATRNATVRMLTDGALGRLTQEHFIELIKRPVLQGISLATATTMVAAGARWLDVRFPEEHSANGLPNSINIPLSLLRNRLKGIDRDVQYIAYCDTGGRSSAAAFLLTEEGCDAYFVENGGIDEIGAQQARAVTATPAPPTISAPRDELVAAEALALSLAADVERARLQIETAQRLMAEAAAAKRDAEQYVQQRLQGERAAIDQAAALVQTKLAEAQQFKAALERQHAAAVAEATRQRATQDAKAEELQRKIALAMQEKEQRLEEVYHKQAAQLEQLHAEQADTRKALDQAWQELELESSKSRERLAAAERLEREIKAREDAQAQSIAEREQQIRDALTAELARERQRFEVEFARSAAEIARARHEQQAAEAANQAAADEARRIMAEYQTTQQRQLAILQQRLLAERAAVVTEAERIRVEMAAALQAKTDAEAARDAAERELSVARERQTTSAATETHLRTHLQMLETRVANAARGVSDAETATSNAAERQRENAQRLERTYSSENELDRLLHRELDDWIEEQERFHGSTEQRAEFTRQQAQTERIKQRAAAAKQAATNNVFSLLDEIAGKIGVDL
ncbi:MAG: cyclic nucleotide-binding domain-containing protein [Gammaproteobacteria bacterium]|nr:cyclic nucleotide-binding domain-containing protein [Gammaproteobacteria bacterium]